MVAHDTEGKGKQLIIFQMLVRKKLINVHLIWGVSIIWFYDLMESRRVKQSVFKLKDTHVHQFQALHLPYEEMAAH